MKPPNEEIHGNDPTTSQPQSPHPSMQPASETKSEIPLATEKILVLAVGRHPDGKLFMVPVDNEHEADGQTPLSPEQEEELKAAKDYLFAHLPELERALERLYAIFAGRLYRTAFRTFENFCFALLGMARIPQEKVDKAMARVRRLSPSSGSQEKGSV